MPYRQKHLKVVYLNNDKQVIWAKLMRRTTALAVIIRSLSWFNSIHFDAIHSWNLSRSHKLEKNTKTPIFEI